jgi:hypothetical protein
MKITPLANFNPVFERGCKPPKSLALIGVNYDQAIFIFNSKDASHVLWALPGLCKALQTAGFRIVTLYATYRDWEGPRLYLHEDIKGWQPRSANPGHRYYFPGPEPGMEFDRKFNGDYYFPENYRHGIAA